MSPDADERTYAMNNPHKMTPMYGAMAIAKEDGSPVVVVVEEAGAMVVDEGMPHPVSTKAGRGVLEGFVRHEACGEEYISQRERASHSSKSRMCVVPLDAVACMVEPASLLWPK